MEANKPKALITNDEFKICFAIPYAYGTHRGQWSHKTILLYKLTMDGENPTPEGEWKRIDNEKGVDNHAEGVMLKDIKKQTNTKLKLLKLEVISSYSPCGYCANKLIYFKESVNVHMSCQAANFYNTYDNAPYREENIKGLEDMVTSGIELSIFKGKDDWERFFVAACVDDDTKKKWHAVAARDERKTREEDDERLIKEYKSMNELTADMKKKSNIE